MINIEVNATEVVNTIDNLAARQLPYAISRAINAVGVDFEKAQRLRLAQVFQLRGNQAWATGKESLSVKFLSPFATKGRLSITMGIDPRVDFLNKFETGETKTPHDGPDIATPDDIRSDPSQIIPPSLRPKDLFADAKADQVFLVRPGDSSRLLPGIWQRTYGHGLQRLYALTPSVPTPTELGFEDTARQTVESMWAQRMSEAFEYALSKAHDNGAAIDARPHDTGAQ